jgi:hypothetical protein
MADGDDVRESDSAEDEIEVHLTLRLRLTDWKALRAQARRQITEDTGLRDTGDREERLDDVDSGPFGALAELIDPDVLVAGIRGVEPLGAIIAVGPPGDDEDEPDFAELFPLDETVDGESDGWLLSPRTASALYGRLLMLGDYARDELEELGDAPITSEADAGMVFSALPGLTWRQDAVWRDRFIGAIDALISDLAGGEWPQPRCPAEEMALHLALRAAEGVVDEPELVEQHVVGLPAHARDYDWEGCRDVFFEDEDILMLYDARLDGVEDPEAEVNRELRIGDYHPAAWFTVFGNLEPRET